MATAMGPMRCLAAGIALALALPACLRSASELPPRGEGLFVSGTVVARDLTSAEIVGIAGATAEIIGDSRVATTDARGFFQLERLPLGVHRILIRTASSAALPASARLLDPVDGLVDGQTIDLGQIELSGTGDLEGFVGLAGGAGLLKPRMDASVGTVPASGALVVATQTVYKAIAGEDGRYLFAGLPQGAFDLVAFRPGYAPAHLFSARVDVGEHRLLQDLILTPSATVATVDVRGSATLEGAPAAGGIAITFTDETDASRLAGMTATAPSGAYDLSLPAGVYRARFASPGYCPVEIPSVAVLPEGVLGLVPVRLALAGPAGAGACSPALPPPGVDGSVAAGGAPRITSFSPTAGGPGTRLSIRGEHFGKEPSAIVLRFGDLGPSVHPESATEGLIIALVPDGAISGPLTLFTSTGSTTSAQSFSFVPGPSIFDFQPRRARRGASVELVGEGLAADGLRVLVTGMLGGGSAAVEAPVRTGTSGAPLIDTVVVGGRPLQRLHFQVPPDAVSGPIQVATASGEVTALASLNVLPGPQITGIAPNPAAPGATILILGSGFSTADTGGEVQVLFSGVSAPQPPVLVTDAGVRVVVPAGASDGPIVVRHPAGEATSGPGLPLIIDPRNPVIQVLSPTLVRADGTDTLTIIGRNLGGSTLVHFGPVAATPASASPTLVTVVVPPGAVPGPVRIDVAGAAVTSTSSGRSLRILRRLDGSDNGFIGAGFSGDGASLYTVRGTTGEVRDPGTLAVRPGSAMAIALPPLSQVHGFQVSPDGLVGVLTVSGPTPQTYLLELPSFRVRASCSPPDAYARGGARWTRQGIRFDAASAFAFTPAPDSVASARDGVFRIDLAKGVCDVVGARPLTRGAAPIGAVVPGPPGQLYVSSASLGLALMDVDPSSPLDGTLLTPYSGIGIPATQLFLRPGNDYLYALDAIAQTPLTRYVPFSDAPPVEVERAAPLGVAIQSADHRWLIDDGDIVDLEAGEVARANLDIGPDFVGAFHPLLNVFVVGGGTAGVLTRLEIDE